MSYRMLLILSDVLKNAAFSSQQAYLLETIVRIKVSVALLTPIVIRAIQAVFMEIIKGLEIKPARRAYMMKNRCFFVVRLVSFGIKVFLTTLTPGMSMGVQPMTFQSLLVDKAAIAVDAFIVLSGKDGH